LSDGDVITLAAPSHCAGCGTELAPSLLTCPGCDRLVHGDRLRALAAEAQRLEGAGDPRAAIEHWRASLLLLPADAGQQATIAARIEALGPRAEAAATGPRPQRVSWGKAGTAAGAAALVLFKFKFVLVFLLTKAKLLLLGLTKLPTLLSMLLSMGLYWQLWGWRFAVGFVLCIYVHEMGHVAALRRLGIPAGLPMFIPGLGALIRLKQHPATPREDMRVGLAGPEWGLGAALLCYAVFLAGGGPFWGALTRVGAWINLFNLLPFWQLDGGRAFHALSRPQRWAAAAGLAAAAVMTGEGLLVLLALVAAAQAFARAPERPDREALVRYLLLVACLSLLLLVDVPV